MAVKLIVIDVRGALQQYLTKQEFSREQILKVATTKRFKREIARDLSQIEDPNRANLKRKMLSVEGRINRIKTSLTTSELWAESEERPVKIMDDAFPEEVRFHFGTFDVNGESFRANWLFRNSTYVVRGNFSDIEKALLIQEYQDAARRKFERLQHKFSLAASMDSKGNRPRIPEDVRVAVWRRDNGCCVRCGSR